MNFTLEKASGRAKCRYSKCERKPEFISANGRIIKDTTCIWVGIMGAGGYCSACYCRDCIDKIFVEMKKNLNPNLWVFK